MSQYNCMTIVLGSLVFILCVGNGVLSGSITIRMADDTSNDNRINTTNNDNFTGLYIIPGNVDGQMILCGQPSNYRRNFTNVTELSSYHPSTWFSFVDEVRISLFINDHRFPKVECQNGTYIRHHELMKKVVYMTLSNNAIAELWNYTFVKFRNLKHLDLSNNNIPFVPSLAFSKLSHLETLDLSRNDLSILDLDYFLSSVMKNSESLNLRYLNLVSSRITSFSCSPTATKTFNESEFYNYNYTLDVSYNNISNISPSCSDKIVTYYKNVTIVMNGITMNCSCSTRRNSTADTTYADLHNCTCPEADDSNISSLKFSYMGFSLCVLTLSFPVIAFGFYIIVGRKEAKRTESPLCRETFCTNVVQITENDPCAGQRGIIYSYVYIVASSKDSDIIDTFVEELETKRNIPVIFQERDEIPGYFKLEMFRKWIHTSKRTVFLLSSNFFQDTHCTHIFKQAKAIEVVEKRVIVIIIKLNDDMFHTEALHMYDMLVNSICLDFTPSEEFWDKLIQIIYNSRMHAHISNTGTT